MCLVFLDALASLDFKLSVSDLPFFYSWRIYGSFRVILYQREKAVCGSGSLAQRDPFSPIKSIVEGTLPLQCA